MKPHWADDPHPQMVSAPGLGDSGRQAPLDETRHRRRRSQAAVILHRMWVTGTKFEFGCPSAATDAV